MRLMRSAFVLFVVPLVVGQEAADPQERFLQHVRFLASDELEGRGTGEPGNAKAAGYLASQFQLLGLEPAGDQGTFRQTFPVAVGMKPGADNRLVVLRGDEEQTLEYGVAFTPFSFSGSGAVEGDAVFAGYGAVLADGSYDDYADIDPKGRVVIVLRDGPESGAFATPAGEDARLLLTKARHAWSRGAAALVVVNDPRAHGGDADRLLPFRQGGGVESYALPALHLTGAAARAAIPDLDLGALQKVIDGDLKPRSRPIDGTRLRLRTDVERERRNVDNVLGRIPAGDAKEVVVLGAHFDHLGRGHQGGSTAPDRLGEIHNGADDNASGTAGLLEVARGLTGRRETLKRSVLFAAFNGEELGLLGSRHLVEHFPGSIENVAAMVNLDMIGRAVNGRVSVIGVGTSPGFAKLVEDANARAEAKLQLALVQGSSGGFGGSDHMSFTPKRIPVLFFFTGAHADYHKPTDDVEKLEAGAAVRVLAVVTEVIERLATAPERPPFVEPARDPHAAAPGSGGVGGFGASLGTVPEYGYEGPGVKLGGVSAGGAAEKAGLKAGDVLTGFDDLKIGTIYDFTNALRSRKPGEKVRVKVLRDGKELALEATLGRRHGGAR